MKPPKQQPPKTQTIRLPNGDTLTIVHLSSAARAKE